MNSDAYYFLSRLDAGETRTEAFFDCIGQLQTLGLLDETFYIHDERVDIQANFQGDYMVDPKLKSPEDLSLDEFWSVVAPYARWKLSPRQCILVGFPRSWRLRRSIIGKSLPPMLGL